MIFRVPHLTLGVAFGIVVDISFSIHFPFDVLVEQ